MNDVLFTIVEGLIVIFMLVILRYALPYLKLKLTNLSDDVLFAMILKEVKSVEQDVAFQLGFEKKDEVMIRINQWCNNHGIKITESQISHLIESAVWVMKEGKNA